MSNERVVMRNGAKQPHLPGAERDGTGTRHGEVPVTRCGVPRSRTPAGLPRGDTDEGAAPGTGAGAG